jgi:hypothetical protein
VFSALSSKQQMNSNRGRVLSVVSVPRCYKRVSRLVRDLVRGLLRLSPCELLLLEAGS